MITVKFPGLHKALTKDVKDLREDDPRRGIIVLDNNAIVFRDNFCLICNLYEYFTIEAEIEDEHELEELERILFFMDGKVFSQEFWTELTKGANMKVHEGMLNIENPKYAKDLHYKPMILDLLEPLIKVDKISGMMPAAINAVGLPFAALKTIYDVLPSDFKQDIIVFDLHAADQPVKFTFRARKHFYGYINPHYDSAQEGYRFDLLEQFAEGVQGLLEELKEKEKQRTAVPAPPES